MIVPNYLSSTSLRTTDKRKIAEKFSKGETKDIPRDLLFPLLFDLDQRTRLMASRALARAQHPALFGYLVRQLKSPEIIERLSAIRHFRYLRNEACVLPLMEALPDEDPDIQKAVVHTLIRLSPKAQRLAASKIPTLSRSQKLSILRAFAPVPAGGELILAEGLKEDEAWIRLEAVKSLSHKKSPLGKQLLLKALKDSFPLVRLNAVQGLQGIQGPQIREALKKMLSDPNIDVSSAAARALHT